VHPQVEPQLRRGVAAAVRQRGVLHVHDQHAGAAGGGQQRRQPRSHLRVHRQIDAEPAEHPVGLQEVTLHVDQHQRGVPRIHQLGELGEHLLALDQDHEGQIVVRPPSMASCWPVT
jgi:hypothetical protein